MVWPRKKKDQNEIRNVRINDQQQKKYCSNEISTAKYNLFTFVPIFLFEQFRRYENIFFLVIAILQQIPNVSPTGRFTTAVPLFIILMVSALKEIFEDFQRHNADKKTNNSKIQVLRNDTFIEIEWKHIQVGDIIKIENGRGVPADTILLSSSEPDAMCYIETSNLDGETNLKLKQGLISTSELTSINLISSIKATVSCKEPSRNLNEFTGTLQLDGQELNPLNLTQLLLRGSSLRNTQWVYGLVLFTGKESKVMLNSSKAPLKRSQVDRVTNKFILVVFGLLFILTVLNTVFNIIWRSRYNKDALWYLPDNGEKGAWYSYILLYITTLLLYNNMVPISLKVTLEMIRMIQAMYIKWDKEMHDEESDTPALARTSNLNEELGQVKYIFSDKTGTLTRNIMVFQACSISGICYGDDEKANNAINDENLKTKIHSNDPDVHKFFEMFAVCHTVVPEYDSKTKTLEYQASSPDERALVLAAKELDYVFEMRSPKGVTINILGEKKNYEILNLLKFTSTRKRMSIILRDPNNKLLLFCKGADNVIFERLESSYKFREETTNHLERFARKGLRTLCFAWCEIDENFYANWKVRYHQASTALDDRDEKLSQVAEEIEKNLHLVGCSAIEDRLQDGVPETISHLARAGINLWVLTGDKQETAINIGYSCQLLTNEIENMVINGEELDEVDKALTQIIEDLGGRVEQQNQYALIIDGPTLDLAFNERCKQNFLMAALSCKVVICCRVSPWQKAEIVRLVKAKVNDAITLAIGDGANDVEMIQAAHVGVGISGREGLQAACASDYAIGQFRFLKKLLLVHGAWNYSRLTKVILYSFYKNICLFIMQFWFAFLNGFSGQVIIERWSLSSYNLIFTSFPPLVMGLFDRNVAMKTCLKYPELYKETLNSASFNTRTFILWILNAIYHSAILFWIPMFAFHRENVYSDGKTCDFFVIGHSIFTYVVVTVCLKAGLEHTAWTYMSHIAIWGSMLSWILFLVIYSYIFPTINIGADMSGMDYAIFRTPLFWVGLFTIPLLCLTRDITWKVLKRSMLQNLRERVMQLEMDHEDPGRIIPVEDSKIKFRGIQFRKSNIFRILKTRSQQSDTGNGPAQDENHGFAFSQEENGMVSQGRLIRAYNTDRPKPTGN